MSKFSKELLKRLDKDVETIVGRTADALVKLLERDREVLSTEQDLAKIRQTTERQMRMYIEGLFQGLETLISAEGHAQEALELREDIQAAIASKLTQVYAFDETYLISDKNFSSQYLGAVNEKPFKDGFLLLNRERQLELHRWVKEILDSN